MKKLLEDILLATLISVISVFFMIHSTYASSLYPNQSLFYNSEENLIWENKKESTIIQLDANGGYSDTDKIITQKDIPTEIPKAIRPGYEFIGWNTQKDGNGTLYHADEEQTILYSPKKKGQHILYAQWGDTITYSVNHYRQNTSFTDYELYETEEKEGRVGDTITPETKIYEGFVRPEIQTITLTEETSTIQYYYDRSTFVVHFDGNGATSGNMNDQVFPIHIEQNLYDNQYKKENHIFSGWNTEPDGTGNSYKDAQNVIDLSLQNGEIITLYAQWIDITDKETEPEDGFFTAKIKAGETIIIPELPNGTKYSITEENIPSGWSIESTENTEGIIHSNEQASAVIKNTYSANGSITLQAYKNMEDMQLQGGEFRFELVQDGNVIQTAFNGAIDNAEQILTEDEQVINNPYYGMSIVMFNTIQYTEPGVYTYIIREVQEESDEITYDTHEETVTVTVTDMLNGLLSCKAVYDADGPVFTNKKIPQVSVDEFGTLLIGKTVTNMDTLQEFSFRLTLQDEEGTVFTDTYTADIVPSNKAGTYTEEDIIESISVTSGTEFHLKSGETIVIKELPAGTIFKAEEINIPDGYELVSADNTEGIIKKDTTSEVLFQNVYDADGSATFEFTKDFAGEEIQENQFKFVLTDEFGVVLQEVYAQTDGKIVFAPVIYSQEDIGNTYHYAVYEIKGEEQGIIYDKHIVDITTKIESTGTSVLSVKTTYDGDTTFKNSYIETKATITAKKIYRHGTLEDGLFQFQLLENDKVVGEAACKQDGTITFPEITYRLADVGTHHYTIKEVISTEKIVWDTHLEEVTVTVAKTGEEEIQASIQYDDDGAVFTNDFQIDFKPVTLTTGGTGLIKYYKTGIAGLIVLISLSIFFKKRKNN